jgi:hypothetical protein
LVYVIRVGKQGIYSKLMNENGILTLSCMCEDRLFESNSLSELTFS